MNARLASAASGGSRSRRFGASPAHFLSGFMTSGYDTGIDALCKSTLLVAVVAALLACGIIYLLVTRWGGKPPVTVHRCEGLACDDPYEALESLLNHTVKPCDDIYEHVCSRWTWNREHVGFLQESLDNYLVQMRAIFETPSANATGAGLASGLRAGGGLYSQCLAAMESRSLTLEEDMFFFLHKFLVSRITDSSTPHDALKVGAEISFTFGLNGLLTLRPQRLDAAAVVYAFKGSALQTSFPAMADLQHYVRIILEAVSAPRAPSLATAVVALDGIVVAHKHRQKSAHKKIPAAELQQKWPALWSLTEVPMKRLAAMSTLASGFLLVRDYENTLDVIRFFETASHADVSWYLVVQMLADLLLFDYITRFELNDKWHVMRACSGAVNKAVTNVWSSLSKQLMLNKTSRDHVSDIFEIIKSTLASNQSYFINFVDNTTFDRIQETLGGISFVSNGELLEIQRNLMLKSGSMSSPTEKFIRNYVAVRHQTRSQSLIWPPNVFWDIASILEMEASASYRDETASLYVSTALQIPHVFYWEEPEHLLNYGTLGALVARELVKSVSPVARINQDEPLWSQEATQSFLKSMICYVGAGVSQRVGNATDFKLELFLWLTSARVAYDALRNDFYDSLHKGKSWTAVQKQFFLRFCLTACESSTATAVSARNKCIWPLAENPAFVQVFNCPQGSFMSSHQKCNA
ncbi:uncharacterized protein LOC144095469 [Amblyomma americanum]